MEFWKAATKESFTIVLAGCVFKDLLRTAGDNELVRLLHRGMMELLQGRLSNLRI